MIDKMMLIEHLVLVFVLITVGYIIFLFAALLSQMLDVDHTCATCASLSERVSLLLRCGKSDTIGNLPEECCSLKRGVFHNVGVFYFEFVILIFFAGLVAGHFIHLSADGYNMFDEVWIIEKIREFIHI
jgi:hypothetical protein